MQALSFHLGLQLPSAISALGAPSPLSVLALLHSDLLCWPRTPLFSKGESLGTQNWHPPYSTLAFSKLTLAGGRKCVYFLDLFFNKKEKEHKVLLWRFCREYWGWFLSGAQRLGCSEVPADPSAS